MKKLSVLLGLLALLVVTPPAVAAMPKKTTCLTVNSKYPAGVAASTRSALSIGLGFKKPTVTKAFYVAHKYLDLDGNGVICEVAVHVKVASPLVMPDELSVVSESQALSDPGMLNDPNPSNLQDGGLNSTFVLKVLEKGQPVAGASVTWSVSDPTASVQYPSSLSDKSGVVRAWLINGAEAVLDVNVKVDGADLSHIFHLARQTPAHVTSGRPVVLTFQPDTSIDYDRLDVTARPNTDPAGTYYAFANFRNFYTGIQSVTCNGYSFMQKVCDSGRSAFRGKEAHFSVWNGLDFNGKEVAPVVVSQSQKTVCTHFDHEGNGQMCSVAFDWCPGDSITISMNKITGAAKGFQRLRVYGQNMTTGFNSEFATIDVPGGVLLNDQFATFNENYEVASVSNCYAVKERSITVTGVKFFKGTSVSAPLSAYVYGNNVADVSTLCQNYGLDISQNGMELHSGGIGRVVDLRSGLTGNGASSVYRDSHQADIMLHTVVIGNSLSH